VAPFKPSAQADPVVLSLPSLAVNGGSPYTGTAAACRLYGGCEPEEWMMLRRISLFASGSVIGTVIDYGVTLGLSEWLRLDPALALALSMIVSATVVFRFHSRVTFDDANDDLLRRYVMFMGWSTLIFFLRAVLLKAFLYTGLPLAIALLGAIGLVSVINFVMSSAVIFAKKSP
tara:strand:+ start:11893 stop:12414 length:522 start_codon:yes stop_codon:yes gene_type:complete